MFSEVSHEKRNHIIEFFERQQFNDFEQIIEKMKRKELISLEDAMSLLSHCHDNPSYKDIFKEQLAKNRNDVFDNQLNIIVPHYHSSRCADNCKYCGFRMSNKDIQRIRLKDNDFIEEMKLLLSWGYRSFEFVYATDMHYKPELIGERIKVAKQLADEHGCTITVGIDAQAFDDDGYAQLKQDGMDFLVLWMETYHHEIYADVHPENTRKADYAFRVNAPERLIKAGCTQYSLGALLGLAPWKEDAAMLMAHGDYLRQTYGYSPYIIGIPKLTPAMGKGLADFPHIIDTDTLTLISWVYKAMFPSAKLFVNSRQTMDQNSKIVAGGGDLFTIDFATFPGDYLKGLSNSPEHQQFETLPYNREEAIAELRNRNFNPVFSW